MIEDPITGYLRAKVVCVFRSGNRILVGDAYDPTKKEAFYCPAGGRIEFGETSEAALRREMREELGAEIENPKLLGILENLFTFNGQPGHEIVFVYDAQFRDRSLYGVSRIACRETGGRTFTAAWLNLDEIGPETPPVYPDGLMELLEKP